MPILFVARPAIQLWYALGKYSKWLILPQMLLVFTNSRVPVLDQDAIVPGAVQTEQRQSLIKYCGLRVVSYKLES